MLADKVAVDKVVEHQWLLQPIEPLAMLPQMVMLTQAVVAAVVVVTTHLVIQVAAVLVDQALL